MMIRKMIKKIIEAKKLLACYVFGVCLFGSIYVVASMNQPHAKADKSYEEYEYEIYYPQPTEEPLFEELSAEEEQAMLAELTADFLEHSDLVVHKETKVATQKPAKKAAKKAAKKSAKKSSKKAGAYKSSKYSEYKVFALAKIIAAEAGGVYSKTCQQQAADAGISSDEWQQYVAYVFLNRVESDDFPDSYEEVMKQGYAQQTIDKFYDDFVTEEALKNAKIAFEKYYSGNCPVPYNMVYQAEFKQGKNYLNVGNTYFGCE